MENPTNPDHRATPSIAVTPSTEATPSGGVETISELLTKYGASDNIDLIYRLHEMVKGAAPGEVAKEHQWNEEGDRCVVCGDKDWFAGPHCGAVRDADEAVHGVCAQGDCDDDR